jgi:integrase
MQVKRFTQENVGNIRPPAGKADHWVEDPALSGFFIRFQNGGEGAYTLRFTVSGQRRKLPLGKVSKVLLADAQRAARQHFATVSENVDPIIERAKAAVASGVLMPSLFDDFESHLRNKRRSDDYITRTMDYLRGTERSPYFKPLHVIPVGEINRATIAREMSRIEKHNGPIAMTRARAALSKFMNWVIQQGHEIGNVVTGTVKYESEHRDRVLQPDELAAIWRHSGADDFGRIVRLLMLTGARRTQIGSLRKAEQRLEPSELPLQDRLIELPGQGRKNSRKGGSKHGDTFLIPLSRQAMAILKDKAKSPRDGDYVFGDGGEGGFSGWSKAKAALDKRIGQEIAEPWSFHDLRRSFETLGHDVCGIPEVDLDHCINHKPQSKQGVKGRYNYAKHMKEKRAAMQTWGDYIEEITKKPAPKLSLVA